MALSSDYVMQVAPGLSAKAAGTATGLVADRALVLSLIVGVIALAIGYFMIRKTIVAPNVENLLQWEGKALSAVTLPQTEKATGGKPVTIGSGTITATVIGGSGDDGDGEPRSGHGGVGAALVGRSKAFAVIVPLAFLALIGYMLLGKFTDLVPQTIGGEAAALVGGVATVLLLFATTVTDRRTALERCAEHLIDGLVFSVKAMGIVLPIAGFFFIGSDNFAGRIMFLPEGAKAPNFLFELVNSAKDGIPQNSFVIAFAILIIGMITGLDGSGFAGLPLTGSLSGALGPTVGMDPATLAAIGQMGCVWSGGGVLIAWSSLIAVAGFARVNVLDLARAGFVPVIVGLAVATTVAVIIF